MPEDTQDDAQEDMKSRGGGRSAGGRARRRPRRPARGEEEKIMSLAEIAVPAVTRTELRKTLDRTKEASIMPLDRRSQANLSRIHEAMRELHHQALGHAQNPATGRRECPDQVCLHEYNQEPQKLLETADLAERAADALDGATFRYRWSKREGPELSIRMTRLYTSRRPHLATALRYGANRIRQSLR